MKKRKIIKSINCKEILSFILYTENKNYQYVSFIDKDGKEDFVYMVNVGDRKGRPWYSEDCCGGYISYNKDNSFNKKSIKYGLNMGCIKLFEDSNVLYELDVYPVFCDFVKYPITNVEFLTEEEVLRRMVEKKEKSFYDNFMK